MKDVSKQSQSLKIFLCSVFGFFHCCLCAGLSGGGRLARCLNLDSRLLLLFWLFRLLSWRSVFCDFEGRVILRGLLCYGLYIIIGLGRVTFLVELLLGSFRAVKSLLLRQFEKELVLYLPSSLTRRDSTFLSSHGLSGRSSCSSGSWQNRASGGCRALTRRCPALKRWGHH